MTIWWRSSRFLLLFGYGSKDITKDQLFFETLFMAPLNNIFFVQFLLTGVRSCRLGVLVVVSIGGIPYTNWNDSQKLRLNLHRFVTNLWCGRCTSGSWAVAISIRFHWWVQSLWGSFKDDSLLHIQLIAIVQLGPGHNVPLTVSPGEAPRAARETRARAPAAGTPSVPALSERGRVKG